MRKNEEEFTDYEQLDDDYEELDFEEFENTIDQDTEEELGTLAKSYFAFFREFHPIYASILDETYTYPVIMMISGALNILYAIVVNIGLFFFPNLLELSQDWFAYSLSILFLLLALNFFISFSIISRKEPEEYGFLKIRSIFYILLALFVFLFPNGFTAFLLGMVAMMMILISLNLIFKSYPFFIPIKWINLREKAMAVVILLIGIALVVLPRFSMFYYHVLVATAIGLRGIWQLYLSRCYQRFKKIEESLEEGFTDYMIE